MLLPAACCMRPFATAATTFTALTLVAPFPSCLLLASCCLVENFHSAVSIVSSLPHLPSLSLSLSLYLSLSLCFFCFHCCLLKLWQHVRLCFCLLPLLIAPSLSSLPGMNIRNLSQSSRQKQTRLKLVGQMFCHGAQLN